MLTASREEFSDNEFNKILVKVMSAHDHDDNDIKQLLFYGKAMRGVYNGFSPMGSKP